MKQRCVTFGTVVCVLALAVAFAAQKDAPKGTTQKGAAPAPQAAASDVTADEKAIHQLIDEVEKAFNAGDAKATAALFTEDAELVAEDGDVAHGRAEIEQRFAAAFTARPGAKIEIGVDSIRSIGPGLLVEDGTTAVTSAQGGPPERSRYTVIHVKQDGKWRMASARDVASVDSSPAEQLQQLAWLVGDWVDESDDSVVHASYRWSDDGNFLLNEFTAQIHGHPAMSGSQRIGWDPLSKQIRSWVFDSAGGFGEGLWALDGERWVIKQRNITPDGQVGTATNVLTRIDRDRWGWQSFDRALGGQLTPEIEQVIVVRKPPKPEVESADGR